MAKAVTDQPHGLATLGSQPQRAEGDAEGVGIDRLQLEAGAVGADGLHAYGATLDRGPQRRPGCGEPLAGIVRRLDQRLRERFQPDDLALRDTGGPLLLLQGEGFCR